MCGMIPLFTFFPVVSIYLRLVPPFPLPFPSISYPLAKFVRNEVQMAKPTKMSK